MEECILRPWRGKFLDIIHYKHIHLHVERKEVSQFVIDIDCIHILCLESVGRHIEHDLLRILFLDGYSYRLGYMRLAKPRPAEKEKRVERGLARGRGDTLACGDTHLVAFTFDQIAETIHRI